jgi:hypothetical protein
VLNTARINVRSRDLVTCVVLRVNNPLSAGGACARSIEGGDGAVGSAQKATGMDWSPDGKGFYCGCVSPESRTLLYVDVKGTPRVLRQYKGVGPGVTWGIPSADGHYIAILGGTLGANVWMVEAF